jgi:hypothetical protein
MVHYSLGPCSSTAARTQSTSTDPFVHRGASTTSCPTPFLELLYGGWILPLLVGSSVVSQWICERLMDPLVIICPTLVCMAVCLSQNNFNGPVVELTITLLVKLCAVIYMSPIFAVPGAVVFGLGSWLGNQYIKAQLSVKREMSNARSPLFSHFNAAIAGLSTLPSSPSSSPSAR